MSSGLINAVKLILSIVIGGALAYFWSTLRPEDSIEILAGVGAVGAIAAFTSFYFMGKS